MSGLVKQGFPMCGTVAVGMNFSAVRKTGAAGKMNTLQAE